MKKETIIELKKKYTTPKMDVTVLKHETNLLQCSDATDPLCQNGGPLN